MNNSTFGLPLLLSRYDICSNRYGDVSIFPKNLVLGDIAEDFVERFIAGCESGMLHDCGHLVVEKKSGNILFMVSERIDDDEFISTEAMLEAEKLFEVDIIQMEMSANGDDKSYKLIAAFLDSSSKFPKAKELLEVIISGIKKR